MIIYRYLLKEITVTWFAVTLVLFLIYISNRFIRYLADAAAGTLPTDAVFYLLVLKSVSSLPALLPLALYLAVLLSLGRMYKDNEMTALSAGGIGIGGVLRVISLYSVLVAFFMFFISFYASPWAQHQALEIKEQAKLNSDFVGLAAGRFKESASGGLVFYTEKLSEGGEFMENVFAHQERGKATNLLSAAQAIQQINEDSGDRFIVFLDGYRYEGTPGIPDSKIISYEEHGIRIETKEPEAFNIRLAARPTSELLGSQQLDEVAELQWRYALPISTLFLTLLAVMLSRTDPRQGRFGKLFIAILVYVVYNNFIGVARNWLEQGVVPSAIGLWWVHALLMVLFIILWTHQMGIIWVRDHVMRRHA